MTAIRSVLRHLDDLPSSTARREFARVGAPPRSNPVCRVRRRTAAVTAANGVHREPFAVVARRQVGRSIALTAINPAIRLVA